MNIKTKVLSLIMVAVTLCGALLSNPLPVHASSNTLDTSTKTGYSYHGVSPYAGEQQFSNFSIMKLNGQPVFCVESHVMAVDGGGYVPETLVNSKKDLLAKIAYYGYTNTSRTNVDYATTQIMIWETLVYNLTKSGYKVSVLADCITCYDKRKIDEMLAYYERKGAKNIKLSELV